VQATELDLLTIDRGSVTAPAGCGKTQLITDAIGRHLGNKPILVLTHTTAGVAALRDRLKKAGVSGSKYSVHTIDGWIVRLLAMFPKRSGYDPALLNADVLDYARARAAALHLLREGHVTDSLDATYAMAIADEYQDCTQCQHLLIVEIAKTLRACVLGDELQAIFRFGEQEPLAWAEACAAFPLQGQLDIPWRWKNAGCDELGYWLLEVRQSLEKGAAIDLGGAPRHVRWFELNGKEDYRTQQTAAQTAAATRDGSVLIIHDSKNRAGRQDFARRIPGAVLVETADLRDLVSFASSWNCMDPDAFGRLTEFAQGVFVKFSATSLSQRVASLRQGRAKKPPDAVEAAALTFNAAPSFAGAAGLLREISQAKGVRSHRYAVLSSCLRALEMSGGTMSFGEAARRTRDESRQRGRPLPKRAVGSTLLLKGLEAEVAVVTDADKLDSRNLYVALTRGSMAVIVCSRTKVLKASAEERATQAVLPLFPEL
jgi:UvrD-like helicase family protein